jgi:hypothetical protein
MGCKQRREARKKDAVFSLAVRGRQRKSILPFEAKKPVWISAAGREAAFYPTASHGRIKENPNPLRLLRLCGERSPYL